uniref:Uncharacterized protein n=1 Tax=Arundo donax TaxID=35708 RepID=A0A0A9GRZ1_ARUDO
MISYSIAPFSYHVPIMIPNSSGNIKFTIRMKIGIHWRNELSERMPLLELNF